MDGISLTICICTSGRPTQLARCLNSFACGSIPPTQVVVSDDSRDVALADEVRRACSLYRFVRYVQGPRQGLCANRNHVVRQSCTSHVSLIDDDGVAHPNFVQRAHELIARFPDTVWTGSVMEDGTRLTPPSNPTFLGHFGRVPRPSEPLRNIHLNCNILPRAAFAAVGFDEAIDYGYEDTDLCAQLLASGFMIRHDPELVNSHVPPSREDAPSGRHWLAERARFYCTIRRHLKWQFSPLHAIGFAVVAPLHLAAHRLRLGQPLHFFDGWIWLLRDVASLRRAQPCVELVGAS